MAQPVVYYGGRVISNVEIVQVSWTPAVDQNYMTQLQGFYTAIVASPFVDWMTEYDTIGKKSITDMMLGSEQHIGRGTFSQALIINPANTKMALTDAEVQTELIAQLTAGSLPPPKFDGNGNCNTLYMLDFPPGYDIALLGLHACQQYGAYHFTLTYQGKSVPYGIHPGCGYDFNTATVVHSHELAEAMTDMEVGLADQAAPAGRPIAWVTMSNNANNSYETGDLCQGQNDVIAGYTVQKIWSNFANGCVGQIPICTAGGAMPPQCRPCNKFDSGAACGGMTPACATTGPDMGHCVLCSSDAASMCMGQTPVCDDATNTCVGCLTSADCKSPQAPVCDTAMKTCHGCTQNADCAMGPLPICDNTGDGKNGQCVECDADTDCPKGTCVAHTCKTNDPATSSSGGPSTGTGSGSGGSGAGGGGMIDPSQPGGLEGKACGCRTVGVGDGQSGLLVVALASMVAAWRRRRS